MTLAGRKRPRKEVSEVSRRRKKQCRDSQLESTSVALDSLSWSKVPFPERFDDAEGFLELEEISDVEVVKDASAGSVAYRVVSKAEPKQRTKPDRVEKNDEARELDDGLESDDQTEEEWSGFEEPSTPQDPEELSNGNKVTKAGDKRGIQVKKAPPLGPQNNQKLNTDQDLEGNSFAALESTDTSDDVDLSDWNELNLLPATLASLARLKFSRPTPIQKKAIPLIRDGHDLIGKASTGSGKTLAFAIPIYEHVMRARSLSKKAEAATVTALILSPTRELAHQLSSHFTNVSSDISIATVTGGLSLHKQKRLLTNADVIIATPGRLWEVLSGDQDLANRLKAAQFLVLDEADRLLSEGHFKEVEEILNTLERTDDQENEGAVDQENEGTSDEENEDIGEIIEKPRRQTLVFSATFQRDLQQKLTGKSKSQELLGKQESMEYLLQKLKFHEGRPQFVDVNPVSQMATNLKEYIVECAGLEKDLYLYSVLLLHPNKRILVFTNSIASVRRLTPYLQNLNLKVHAIHSQMPQKARLRSIERFSAPSASNTILVATDVAARGLDIPLVDLVLHYHVPHAADMYVHRSGRTARAERSGESILLCSPEEVQGVRRLAAKVHARNALDPAASSGGGGGGGGGGGASRSKFYIRTLDLDRRIVAKLKVRATLSKKISDAGLAKEKKNGEDNWLRTAAEELGVDYDSEEFAAAEGSKRGRGQGRKRKEKEARGLTKDDLGALRAELKQELGKRVNVGVSERYLTAGGVDIDELLRGEKNEFLGRVDTGLGEA